MERIVFYDGLCGFCDVSIQWLLAHDTDKKLRFAPLQGETARAMKNRHPEIPENLDSILFLEISEGSEKLTWHSSAAFAIASVLPSPWSWLRVFRILPRFFTDFCYQTFARYRYYVWGRKESCRIPSPAERMLFLP